MAIRTPSPSWLASFLQASWQSAYEQSRGSMPKYATHKKLKQEIMVPSAKLRDFGAGLNTSNVYLKLDAEGPEELLPSSLPAFLRELSNKVVFILIVGEYSFDNLKSSCKKYRRWLDELRNAGDGEGWCCVASRTDNPPAGATEDGWRQVWLDTAMDFPAPPEVGGQFCTQPHFLTRTSIILRVKGTTTATPSGH